MLRTTRIKFWRSREQRVRAKYAKGGRTRSNTQVYHVTNLNADGEGSLADAVSQSGRIIVFDVGGTIHLKKPLHIDGVTILGQTAPGDGITIADANVDVNSSSIIRYLRVRLGIVNGLESDTFGGTAGKALLIIAPQATAWTSA